LRLSKDLKKVCTYFDNVKRQLSKFLPWIFSFFSSNPARIILDIQLREKESEFICAVDGRLFYIFWWMKKLVLFTMTPLDKCLDYVSFLFCFCHQKTRQQDNKTNVERIVTTRSSFFTFLLLGLYTKLYFFSHTHECLIYWWKSNLMP
jgi:hypothetical protein